MKKTSSQIFTIVLLIGIFISTQVIYAYFIRPTATAPGDNTPAPILTGELGDINQVKIGKLGLGVLGKAPDTDQFTDNSLVIGGQMYAEALTSQGVAVFNTMGTTQGSVKNALLVGNPNSVSINQDKTARVLGNTKAIRMSVGSFDTPSYNLHIFRNSATGNGTTNLTKAGNICALKKSDMEQNGRSCPEGSVLTYLTIGTNASDYVGRCTYLAPWNTSVDSQFSKDCY